MGSHFEIKLQLTKPLQLQKIKSHSEKSQLQDANIAINLFFHPEETLMKSGTFSLSNKQASAGFPATEMWE